MFRAEKLLEEGSSLKREVDMLILDCLFGLPLEGRTLTVRRGYDPQMGGRWIKIPPHDGEGIKAIKEAVMQKWGLIPEKDFKVYSKEEEKDKILYLEFAGELKTITLELNVFEYGHGI